MAATATAANVCASVRINSFRAWRLFRACCRVKARGHRSDALDSKIFFSSNQMSHDLCSQPVPSPTLNSCDAGSLTSTPIPPNSTPPNSSPSEPPKPSRLPASRSPRSLRYAPREKRNGRNLIFCLYFWLMRQEHLLRASSDPPPLLKQPQLRRRTTNVTAKALYFPTDTEYIASVGADYPDAGIANWEEARCLFSDHGYNILDIRCEGACLCVLVSRIQPLCCHTRTFTDPVSVHYS